MQPTRIHRFLALLLCLALIGNSLLVALPQPAIAAPLPQDAAQPVALTADCYAETGNVFLPTISGRQGGDPGAFGFGAIAPQRASLGGIFRLGLPVNNPTKAPLTFTVAPLPLPANTTFDPTSGRFTFAPAADQVGDYTFTFTVSNGAQQASTTVPVTVPAPDPNGITTLCGRILDANAANGGRIKPLVGATVRLMTSPIVNATTDERGYFLMVGIPAGEHYFEYDGSTATPAGAYGAYRGQKVIVASVTNIVDRPLYIMAIDKAGETAVNPNAQTVVKNPNINVTVTIPPNTVLDDNGQVYRGPISVSPVPDEFTPAALPDTLDPSRVLTIQPMGLTFRNPAPISFPNNDGLAVGSIVDIWSLDHELGKFFIAGKGEVKANGMIETIEGGIRESSWHFPMPLQSNSRSTHDSKGNKNSSCKQCPCPEVASRLKPTSGCLETAVVLPGYVSIGETRQLEFTYLSEYAYPVPILPFEATLPARAAIPTTMEYQLRNFGGLTSGLAAPVIWNKSVLNENKDEPLRGAVSVNGSTLNTGIYPYSIQLTNHYGAASVSSDVNGQYPLVNEQNSAFGAGWGLAGLQRIYPQPDDDLLLVNGDGSSMRFESSNVLLEDNFDNEGPRGLNYSTLLNWRITRGSVDLFGPGWEDFYPGNGNYLDLDGSTGTAVRLETQTDILLLPGDYQLSFTLGNTFLAGNPQAPQNAENRVQVSLGNLYSSTFSFTGQSALQSIDAMITVANPTAAKWVFDHAGGDYYGIILDNVKLERVKQNNSTSVNLQTTMRVDAKSNIFASGHPVPPAPSGGGGGVRPSGIQFLANSGQVFTFPAVSGNISANTNACGYNGPDGATLTCASSTSILSYGGIAGIVHTDKFLFLTGVFIDEEEPVDPAPSRLTFSSSQDFTSLSPGLNQVFFIGDGKTSTGVLQQFIPPVGTKRLLLGFADSLNFDGLPGYYDDNVGELSVTIELTNPGATATEFTAPEGDFSTLTRNADNTYTRRLKDGTEYHFNAAGLQTAMIDRNGNRTVYTYDDQGRLTTITDPANLVTTFTYNGPRLQSVTDPMQRVTTFAHNGAGDLVKVTFPDGSSKGFGYDDRHLMTSETDERGFVTNRTYDAYGRLVSAVVPGDITRSTSYAQKVGLVTDPNLGTATNPAPIARPAEVKTTITDGENRTTTYTFGPLQSIATTSDPAGLTTTIERDRDSNPTKSTYPSGQVINQSFDSRGNPLTINDPTVQGTTSIGYEALFNQPVTIKDPFNNVTTLSYDSKGNPIRIASPLNRTVRMAYNSVGLPTVMTDTLGTVANFGYDQQGNLTNLSWGGVRTATFGYTPHGYLQSMTDPLNRGFAYQYDAHGRLLQETLPGARTVRYQYDAAGNLTGLTPPDRPAHSFEYDGLGQMTAYIPPAVTGAENPRTSYEYNKAQQLTKLIRPDGLAITYGYDPAGRLQTTQFSRGALGYSYNATTGQLSGITAPGNVNLGFQYKGDLLVGESWSGALTGNVQRGYDAGYRTASISVNNVPITYQYEADNAPIRAGALILGYQPATGLLATTAVGAVNDSYGYNAFGELQSYRANVGATPLFQTGYARDSLGRITTLTETITNTTNLYVYGYDAAGRLATVIRNGAQIASYSYDANGNRTNTSDSRGTFPASYDNQDRLLSYGSATYSYSANGELQSKVDSSQKTEYSYDEFGNLTRVALPTGEVITYLIDGKDRRVGKQVNGVLQKGWLYEDQLRPVAELDGSGAVVSRFVYATRVNVPDYMVKANVTYRLVLDHLGSVRLVVDPQGRVIQRLDYDAWGLVTQDTNPGFQPFGFAGGQYDGQTGLVRFGARDYDPVVGRWTAKDPIGFDDDLNLFGYVSNDPINFIDPDGLSRRLGPNHIDPRYDEHPRNRSGNQPGGSFDRLKQFLDQQKSFGGGDPGHQQKLRNTMENWKKFAPKDEYRAARRLVNNFLKDSSGGVSPRWAGRFGGAAGWIQLGIAGAQFIGCEFDSYLANKYGRGAADEAWLHLRDRIDELFN
ncbi:MAG: RHS repeat-associated core domain-containing protein [Caldilineaceae bacterium]